MAVAMRTDNYFELRNRGMGLLHGITKRNHSRVHERRSRGWPARSPIILPTDSSRRPLMGKQNRTFDYSGVCYRGAAKCLVAVGRK